METLLTEIMSFLLKTAGNCQKAGTQLLHSILPRLAVRAWPEASYENTEPGTRPPTLRLRGNFSAISAMEFDVPRSSETRPPQDAAEPYVLAFLRSVFGVFRSYEQSSSLPSRSAGRCPSSHDRTGLPARFPAARARTSSRASEKG